MRASFACLALLFVSACSSTGSTTADLSSDASVVDAGLVLDAEPVQDAAAPDADPVDAAAPDAFTPDAMPVDAGPPICPTGQGGACASASDCATPLSPPTNCPACVSYTRSLCESSACVTPALLGAGDVHNVAFEVPSSVPMIQSFAGYVLATRTAGGAEISCADVYAGALAFDDPCLNVLDTRAIIAIAQTGTTYTMSFSRFASGQRSLFVVVGYSEEGTSGTRQGISCTAADVGAPGSGRVDIAGDPMRRLP